MAHDVEARGLVDPLGDELAVGLERRDDVDRLAGAAVARAAARAAGVGTGVSATGGVSAIDAVVGTGVLGNVGVMYASRASARCRGVG